MVTLAVLLAVALLGLVLLTLKVRELTGRLSAYEFVDGPRILELPMELCACPDCGRALWGALAVERMPLTGAPGVRFVTAVPPDQIRADGTPLRKQINVVPELVEDSLREHRELGWCPLCKSIKALS
jgi:hypothetical protein